MENSFEVFLVFNKMCEMGFDMYLDIYGDEVIFYNFVVGSEGILGYDDCLKELEDSFKVVFLIVMFEF